MADERKVRVRWQWLAPEVEEALRACAAGAVVRVDGQMSPLPAAPLLDAGCVASWRFEQGRLVIDTSLAALIAAEQTEALRGAVETGHPFTALSGRLSPTSLYLLVRALGDGPATRRLCSTVANGWDDSLEVARAWALLLGDRTEAERLLTAAEASVPSLEGAIRLAAAYAAVLEGARASEAVERCLERAARVHGAPLERAELAQARAAYAADSHGARRDLEALAATGGWQALLAAAAGWRLCLFDPERALAWIEATEQLGTAEALAWAAAARAQLLGDAAGVTRDLDAARALGGHCFVARVLVRSLSDEAGARATLEEAERTLGSAPLSACAEVWLQLFHDEGRARGCLRAAEGRAQGASDWVACAAVWKDRLGALDEVRRCLAEIERHATSAADWIGCVRYSVDVGEVESARRCLGRAEEVSASASELIDCARAWEALIPGGPDRDRCLVASEAKAEGLGLLVCAEGWVVVGGASERAADCIARAAREVVTVPERIVVAQSWARVLGRSAEARALLESARQSASTEAHWAALAVAFDELLGDAAVATDCRVREMELGAGDDLVALATGWRRILGDTEDSRGRLRAREQSASGIEAWERLVEAWQRGFSDETEVARCQEWVERWRIVEQAMQAGDWTAFARAWREILGDEEAARARLRAVEERARVLTDWTAFARAWSRVFEDADEARRCMLEAEGLARFKSEWKQCSEGWRDIGNYAEAERCANHR
jgi:hypothetical protein